MTNVATMRRVKAAASFEKVTPAKALDLLGGNRDNRNLRAGAVHAYADEMTLGEWLVTGESIKLDWNNRLIDGQHRLQAIVESGRAQTLLIVTGLDPRVQTVIDTPVKRQAADVLKWAGLVEENAVVCAAVARISLLRERGFITGYGSLSGGAGATGRRAVSHTAIVDWVTEHPEVKDAARWGVKARSAVGIAPSPLGYVYLELHKVAPVEAETFLDNIVTLTTEGPGDPRYALLQSFRLNGDDLQRRPGAIIGLSFAAWNAWRDKQNVRTLPLNDGKGNPRKIETPV